MAGAGALTVPGALRRCSRSARQAGTAALAAKADAVIFIWLPGGIAQTDTWDPKRYTPFEAGMKGSELLGTCESIPTSVDGLRFGQGLENIASVMHHGTLLRSLTNETKFGAVHLKAQYYMLTGYLFPVGLKAPSIGAAVARTLGPRNENVPPYIYIGRDVDTSDTEKQFISEAIGPGFYGVKHAPFMIPDPTAGLATLTTAAGMTTERLDRRLAYLQSASKLSDDALRRAQQVRGLSEHDDASPGHDGLAGQAGLRLRKGRNPLDAGSVRAEDRPRRAAGQEVLLRQAIRPWVAAGATAGRERRAVRAGRVSVWAVQGLRHARGRPARAWSR